VSDPRGSGHRVGASGPVEVLTWVGDITDLEVDAIVNAANNQGWLGSGVAGAIRRAAGDVVEDEAVAQGPWEIGGAVRTGPGRLGDRGVRAIIHAAAMGSGVRASSESVESATAAALDLAAADSFESIALPALGTGVGGLGEEACAAAMGAALRRHGAGPTSLRLAVLAIFDRVSLLAFEPALAAALGRPEQA
jgi:O-acetyl-ADP-ribose deacetylase